MAGGELIDPRHAGQDEKRAVFEHLSDTAALKGFKPGWASHRFREMFGHWPKGFVSDVRAEQISQRWKEKVS